MLSAHYTVQGGAHLPALILLFFSLLFRVLNVQYRTANELACKSILYHTSFPKKDI